MLTPSSPGNNTLTAVPVRPLTTWLVASDHIQGIRMSLAELKISESLPILSASDGNLMLESKIYL